MRKRPKPTEQEINEGAQTVSFQMAHGNASAELHTANQAPNEGTGANVLSL
jgi:hypothetical protein